MRKLFIFLLLLACVAAYGQAISKDLLPAVGSGELSSVKFGGKKLPSWLNSEYVPIFNGVNQYAVTPTFSGLNDSEFTIMFWSRSYNLGNIVSARGGKPNNWVLTAPSSTTLNLFLSGTFFSAQSVNTITDWHHSALVVKSGSGSWYLDGLLRGIAEASATRVFVNTYLTLGAYSSSVGQFGNNTSAELSIWNRALSQDEILRYKDKRLKGTETGLVAYYPMNEPPGSTVFVDKVGGKNAVASNSVQITKRNGYTAPDVRSERYTLSFDGVDDLASGTNTGITTYPVTLEQWVFVSAIAAGKTYGGVGIADVATTTAQTVYCGMAANAPNVRLNVASMRNGALRLVQYQGIVSNGWHHNAAVITPTSVKAYLDGIEVGSSTVAQQYPDATPLNSLTVGAIWAGTLYRSTTKTAETRIWNTARTQAEIQANLYTQMTGSESGLVYYYRGNEGTGTTMTNLGSAGASGSLTLYNSPTWVGRDIP